MFGLHFEQRDKNDIPGLAEENPDGQGPWRLIQISLSRYVSNNQEDLKEYPRSHPKAIEGKIYLALLIVKSLRIFDGHLTLLMGPFN